jgi:prepilin-type N-terminal cleavage/methylation domain-containing protein
MRKNSGFTTYELMMTIAIMAVIAAISMPPYLKWYRSSRLRSAVSNVTADLEMAKTEAIRENALWWLNFIRRCTKFLSTAIRTGVPAVIRFC